MSLDWGTARAEDEPTRPAPAVLPPEPREWRALDEPRERPVRAAFQDEKRTPRKRAILRFLVLLALLPFALSAVYMVVPPVSTLMLARWATLRPVERTWVPLSEINPALPRGVIASEDGFFCAHSGVDWGAMREVFADSWIPDRGASTVTMQVAKNLFLWQGFGYIRKPVEIALAYWLELIWSKDRIMEVYLNVVEWGPDGVFGAEAGAQKAFRKSARDVSAREASILVAALPNPVVRNPAKPGPRLIRRAGRLAPRYADTSCLTGL